jgi:hypothetical protein
MIALLGCNDRFFRHVTNSSSVLKISDSYLRSACGSPTQGGKFESVLNWLAIEGIYHIADMHICRFRHTARSDSYNLNPAFAPRTNGKSKHGNYEGWVRAW